MYINSINSFESPLWTHRLVVGGGNAARADVSLICIVVRAAANESASWSRFELVANFFITIISAIFISLCQF
jgi:hypothetical protein